MPRHRREPSASSSCQNRNKFPLEIDIKTDQFGNETSFKVRKRKPNGKFKKVAFQRDTNFFDGNQEYYFKKCLPKKSCFKFFIIDEYGDGFGVLEEGEYTVRWNGTWHIYLLIMQFVVCVLIDKFSFEFHT